MMYLSERVLNPERFFLERCFVKRNNAYYFIANEENENIYSCVKLFNENNKEKFGIEVVRAFVNRIGDIENIVKEEVVLDKKERKDILYELFFYLSHEDNPEDVIFFEEVIDFIHEYIEDGYFYASNDGDSVFVNSIYGNIMELFGLEGKVVEGYYEGNLVLTDIKLVNMSTGQIIKSFNNVNLCSNFYVDEDEDIDYMIEGYLESMSQYDIKQKFENAMFLGIEH